MHLELQNRDMKNFVRRTRYYVSQLQVNYYSKNKEEKERYEGVPQVISIWLCTFPNFRYGDKKNTLVSYNKEMGMIVEDGVVRVFVDVTKWEKFSPKLRELFHFLIDSSEEIALQAHWDIVRLLYRNMVEMKKNPKKEAEYMTYNKAREIGFDEGWENGREEGREEGKAEGREKGREEREFEIIRSLADDKKDSAYIARIVGMDKLTVETILKKLLQA